jgi:CDP-diacylglycerol--inositol 3-phosphatidyltransferase
MLTKITARDVLLYYPNGIGYGRVLCTLASLTLMTVRRDPTSTAWVWAVALYLVSFVGDLVDGMVARKYNQTSTFGSVLDMITDRCSTLGLLIVLYQEYSASMLLQLAFLSVALLDISSHWCQMYSALQMSAVAAAQGEVQLFHHKSEQGNKGRHFLVRWFYQYYWFFGYLCVGAEFTFVLLYIRTRIGSSLFPLVDVLLGLCVPGCLAKQAVNVSQLCSACYLIADFDAYEKNKTGADTDKKK